MGLTHYYHITSLLADPECRGRLSFCIAITFDTAIRTAFDTAFHSAFWSGMGGAVGWPVVSALGIAWHNAGRTAIVTTPRGTPLIAIHASNGRLDGALLYEPASSCFFGLAEPVSFFMSADCRLTRLAVLADG